MPQFHNSIVDAVHSSPLAADANHTRGLSPCTGGGPLVASTHTTSITVPLSTPYAVTTSGECSCIRCRFSRIQPSDKVRDTTTSRSPLSDGPPAACACVLLRVISVTPH